MRERVRRALADAFLDAAREPEAAARRFDEAVRDLRSWPVERYVEDFLRSDDERLAVAAVRCLGLRGDRLSVVKLRKALARPELSAVAVVALGRRGSPAVPALAEVLDAPDVGDAALRELAAIGGAAAAAALEEAAASAAGERRERLLDALADTGPSAVAVLLREAARSPDDSAATLFRLKRVDGGESELARIVATRAEEHPRDVLLDALVVLQPESALPWLEKRCADYRPAAALACLSRWRGTTPLEVLLRLDAKRAGAGRRDGRDAQTAERGGSGASRGLRAAPRGAR